MTLLLLIRHGENDLMHKRMAGRLPGVHLNENGRQQAEKLAQALQHAPIQEIYSSPMERALETAEPLARGHNLSVQIRPGLNEVHYGDWQGRTYKQLQRLKLWKTLAVTPSQVRLPAGESYIEVQNRVVAELEALAHEEEPPPEREKEDGAEPWEKVIAVVAHGDVVRLALANYLNMALDDYQRLHISLASLTIVRVVPDKPAQVICMNQIPGFSWPEPPQPSQKSSKKRKKHA